MKTKFLLLLLFVSASAKAQLFKGINTAVRSIPKTVVAAKAAQSLAHQQQVLQQQKILQNQIIQTSKVPQSKVRSYPSTPTHLSQTAQKNEIAKDSAKIMKTEKSD